MLWVLPFLRERLFKTEARTKNKTARAIQTQLQRDKTKQTKLSSKSQTENKTEYKLVK